MPTDGYEATYMGMSRIHTCQVCGWYRNLDPKKKRDRFWHKIYGVVTLERAAELDVREHDCDKHQTSVSRLIRVGIKGKG